MMRVYIPCGWKFHSWWWQRPSQVEGTIWTKSRPAMHGECVGGMQIPAGLLWLEGRSARPSEITSQPSARHSDQSLPACLTQNVGNHAARHHRLLTLGLSDHKVTCSVLSTCTSNQRPKLALPELGPSSSLPKETST